MNWKLVVAAIVFWPIQAHAVELHYIDVAKGTEGLVHVPVDVRNTGTAPLSCTIELAHWYSMNLGEALPGGRTVIDMWFDPAKGAYLVLNDRQDNMPIEAAWCGIAGKAYQTRVPIILDRSKGASPKSREIKCAAAGDRLACK